MTYILPSDAVNQLNTLRDQYEEKKGISLQQATSQSSLFQTPKMFGGINKKSRLAQISFIEKILAVLKINLIPEDEIKTTIQWQANLSASRLLLAACIYVRNDIKQTYYKASPIRPNHSVLRQALNECLGIKDQNQIDHETIKASCFAAQRLLKSNNAFEEANALLKEKNIETFSEDEWRRFIEFVEGYVPRHEKEEVFKNWPFTSIAKPVFGYTASAAGAAVGMVGGDLLGVGMPFLGEKKYIAKSLGSGIVWLGIGSFGPMFIAPVVAGKLVDSFLQIFLAKSLYISSEKIGRGAGVVVGMPLDLTYQLLCHAYEKIPGLAEYEPQKINGIQIADGNRVESGIILPLSEYEENQDKVLLITERQGVFYLGEDAVAKKEDLNKALIAELKSKGYLQNETKPNTQEEDTSPTIGCG